MVRHRCMENDWKKFQELYQKAEQSIRVVEGIENYKNSFHIEYWCPEKGLVNTSIPIETGNYRYYTCYKGKYLGAPTVEELGQQISLTIKKNLAHFKVLAFPTLIRLMASKLRSKKFTLKSIFCSGISLYIRVKTKKFSKIIRVSSHARKNHDKNVPKPNWDISVLANNEPGYVCDVKCDNYLAAMQKAQEKIDSWEKM